MVDMSDGTWHCQLEAHTRYCQTCIPTFTWGFFRSNTVAIPRTPLRSWANTCWTGFMPLLWRRANLLVRIRGVRVRARAGIVRGPFDSIRKGKERFEVGRAAPLIERRLDHQKNLACFKAGVSTKYLSLDTGISHSVGRLERSRKGTSAPFLCNV